LGAPGEAPDALVREAEPLPADEVGDVCASAETLGGVGDLPFRVDEQLDLANEPGVDGRQRVELLGGNAGAAGLRKPEEAAWRRRLHFLADLLQLLGGVLRAGAVAAERRGEPVGPVRHGGRRALPRR